MRDWQSVNQLQGLFFLQKFIYKDCRVISGLCRAAAANYGKCLVTRARTTPFVIFFRNFPVTCLIDILSWNHELPDCLQFFDFHRQKNVQGKGKKKRSPIPSSIHSFIVSSDAEYSQLGALSLAFCFLVMIESIWFVTCSDAGKEIQLPLKVKILKVSTYVLHMCLLLHPS